MDSTQTQVYEDFVPSTKLVQEEHLDTLHLTLQGLFLLSHYIVYIDTK